MAIWEQKRLALSNLLNHQDSASYLPDNKMLLSCQYELMVVEGCLCCHSI